MACIQATATRVSFSQKVTLPSRQGSCFLGGSAKLRSHAATATFQTGRKSVLPVLALAAGIVVTSKPANAQGQVEIDATLPGSVTQAEFDKVVKELGTNSPIIPGYRKGKGGKNAKVPKQVLINMFGKKRLYGFVVDGLVSNTLLDWSSEEGLETEKEAKVTQDTAKLLEDFAPGKEIKFNAILQLIGDFSASEEIDDAIDVKADSVEAVAVDVVADAVEDKQ